MNRRGFLKGIVGAVAGTALAEELSTTSIFLPPRGGWATGKIATTSWVTTNVRLLHNVEEVREFLGPYTTEVPQFLTNFFDPKLLDILLRKPGESDREFIRRFVPEDLT